MNQIKKIFLLICIFINYQTISTNFSNASSASTFSYSQPKTTIFPVCLLGKLLSSDMTLPSIEQAIVSHIAKRKLENWVFTDTRIHNATLQAIHAYNSLDDQNKEKHSQELQYILNSHAYFLYHPLYLNKRKHVNLVDAFMYSATGKRYEISRLDGIEDQVRVFGVQPSVIVAPSTTSNTSSTPAKASKK